MENTTKSGKPKKTCYLHFSFRRPKGQGIGIFAACIYADYAGEVKVCKCVRQFPLWEDQMFVTAIQAYEHALRCIWEWQGHLIEHGVTDVELVTDNSTLAGWILDHKKNRNFTKYMDKAVAPYRTGGAREIMLSVGLDQPRKYEKSYKYCQPDLVENRGEPSSQVGHGAGRWKVPTQGLEFTFIDQMAKDLEVEGIELPLSKLN